MNKAKYLSDVMTNMEAEEIISRQLREINLENYGSEEFIKQHVTLERLNMQAVKNALLGGEDFILENFVTFEKIKNLVQELFTAFNFKNYIYPKIKNKICDMASCKVYILLYHEAVIINLLENFFFHVTACLELEDYIIDIIEYCYNKISRVVNNKDKRYFNNIGPQININDIKNDNQSSVEEMEIKNEEIEFYISMACISIMRYITDHLLQLPFPVRNHVMNVKDVPLLLVAVMETKPWVKEINSTQKDKEKDIYIFENNHWVKHGNNNTKLPKLEAQVWISIFNLFMNSDNNKKYEITEFRKNNLLRIRKYMNESLYDQIPPLQQLFRALEEMSLMQYNSTGSNNPFVVEIIPLLYNKKIKESEIIRISELIQNKFFSKLTSDQLKKEMDLISEVYSMGNMEYFMEDPKCANCNRDATSRCSKCKSEWYCGRDCQVKRWKSHKEMCSKLAELNNEINEQPSSSNTQDKLIEKIIEEPKHKISQTVKNENKFEELD
jgi:predicted Zn-ribbon and HTH transcriptional regulator